MATNRPGTFRWSVRADAWDISRWRLALGILGGVIIFAIADGVRYALGYLNNIISSSSAGITYTSDVITFVQSDAYLVMVVALIVVSIVHSTIRKPFTVRGPVKMLYGALLALFYYFILAGGIITVTVGVQKPVSADVLFSLTLLVTLGLLVGSAVLRILQGGFEFREGMGDAAASLKAAHGAGASSQAAAPPQPPSAPAPQQPAAPPGASPAAPSGGTMFCTACGKRLAPDESFCTSCGSPRAPPA